MNLSHTGFTNMTGQKRLFHPKKFIEKQFTMPLGKFEKAD